MGVTADCRKLASRLHSLAAAVPLYDLFVDLGAVAERPKVDEAARALIGLSHTRATLAEFSTRQNTVQEHYDTISKCLRIRLE
jgi:hypothetical protein